MSIGIVLITCRMLLKQLRYRPSSWRTSTRYYSVTNHCLLQKHKFPFVLINWFDYMLHPPLWRQAETWSRIYVPQIFLGWLLRTCQSAIGRFLLTFNWLKENTLAHHVLVIPEMSSFLVNTGIEALSSVPVSEAYSNSTSINVYIKEKIERDQLSSFFFSGSVRKIF